MRERVMNKSITSVPTVLVFTKIVNKANKLKGYN